MGGKKRRRASKPELDPEASSHTEERSIDCDMEIVEPKPDVNPVPQTPKSSMATGTDPSSGVGSIISSGRSISSNIGSIVFQSEPWWRSESLPACGSMPPTSSTENDVETAHELAADTSSQESEVAKLEEMRRKRTDAQKLVNVLLDNLKIYSKHLYETFLEATNQEALPPSASKKAPQLKKGKKSTKRIEELSLPVGFRGSLMEYQIEGFSWLMSMYANGVNCILADEMGLGKTVQAIAVITELCDSGNKGPFLVIAPLSTLQHWKLEFNRFAPKVPVVLCHGTPEFRKSKYLKLTTKSTKLRPVIITNYSSIMVDYPYMSKIEWRYVIVDEAQRLKNSESKFFSQVKQLKFDAMILMTGTPLQNNLSELWSLLHILLPQVFNNLKEFEAIMTSIVPSKASTNQWIIKEEQKDHMISCFQQILTPFMLRRTKSDVNVQLPLKKELNIDVPLTTLQNSYYQAILENTIEELLLPKKPETQILGKRKRKQINYAELNGSDTDDDVKESLTVEKKSPVTQIVNLTMTSVTTMLRKACMHPYLICWPVDLQSGQPKVDEGLVNSSGKLLLLDALLPKLRSNGHKVLIFSQFCIMLDILEDYCELRSFPVCRIDGRVSLKDRVQQMNEFNNESSSFLFLLSTRAGGLGINLTGADTVILYDSDWNPQCDNQAIDRCHRIGQTKPVVVYRLMVKNTIEDYICDVAMTKRKLEKLIIKKDCYTTNDTLSKTQKPLSEEDMLSVLKGAEITTCSLGGVLLSDEKLEELLDRS